MKIYTQCIVREPCAEMVEGLSTADLGLPDFRLAQEQHKAYITALEKCGCRVHVLPPDPRFPDSVFVEDPALLIGKAAVIARPGAESRRNESLEIKPVLEEYFANIEEIVAPGTLDAGDVLEVEGHFYIGLSGRTNEYGADQLIYILNRYGKTGSTIALQHFLHLKTGVAFLGNNTLLLAGELKKSIDFKDFNRIEVVDEEAYAANSIWINGKVIMPSGYPGVRESLLISGFDIIEVDTSEFLKLDGGISCLSLRF